MTDLEAKITIGIFFIVAFIVLPILAGIGGGLND